MNKYIQIYSISIRYKMTQKKKESQNKLFPEMTRSVKGFCITKSLMRHNKYPIDSTAESSLQTFTFSAFIDSNLIGKEAVFLDDWISFRFEFERRGNFWDHCASPPIRYWKDYYGALADGWLILRLSCRWLDVYTVSKHKRIPIVDRMRMQCRV